MKYWYYLFAVVDKPRPPQISDSDLYPEQGKIAKASCEFDANPPATVFYVKENPATKAWTRISTQTVSGVSHTQSLSKICVLVNFIDKH